MKRSGRLSAKLRFRKLSRRPARQKNQSVSYTENYMHSNLKKIISAWLWIEILIMTD